MTGVVRDQAGAAVPGATITVTERQDEPIASREDEFRGRVHGVRASRPAPIASTWSSPASGPCTARSIRVSTGQTVRLDFELAVGDVREQVTVTGETPLLREESASLGAVVEHEQVVQLPLNGRTFITLATLAPGVALPPGTQLPRINGGRPRTNEYLFDGISVLQPEPGQVAYFPIIDAIQEFKIESNSPPAEFGRFNGGVINLTTRSGANAFHGNAFEFFRNNALNATNYFQAALQTKPDYDRSQFGGTAGGPIVADRTFFFVDYQGQRQTIGRTVTSTVPTLLQRQRHLHRGDRWTRADHLRPRDDGGLGPHAVSGQHDPRRAASIRFRCRCCSGTRCRPRRHREQLLAARPTKWTTRISGTSASTTGFRRTAIRCSAASRTSGTASSR